MSLFKVIINATKTTENRLMIDVRAAREAYEKFEINYLGYLCSDQNAVDGLTKPKSCAAFEKILEIGRLDTKVQQMDQENCTFSD